ncbi:hypothetical protein COLO4_20067 [Corchorus olitorius]|uniref:Uncharacterized protein n=1 Tax=Corchorus olitorius TaxID=93759 RepID=A0A1R3J1V1_9ROSI|nr:hypothetical protein COLO4_20067 [Corchorus olitorius]
MQKPYPQGTFETSSDEVLQRADFRIYCNSVYYSIFFRATLKCQILYKGQAVGLETCEWRHIPQPVYLTMA